MSRGLEAEVDTRLWWFSRWETEDSASLREAGWRHHDHDT